jgi:hypothetical protein
MAVDYEEIEGSPTYRLDTTISAQRVLKIAWDDIDALVAELSPYPGNNTARFPGRPLLWVKTIDIVPWPGCVPTGAGEVPASYEFARATVNYEIPKWDNGNTETGSGGGAPEPNSPNNETWLSQRTTVGGEYMVLPTSGLVWEYKYNPLTNSYSQGTDKVLDDVHAGMIVPLIEYQLTYHRVAFPPWRTINEAIGKLNDVYFSGCPAETLLFTGAEGSVEFSTQGFPFWTLDYKFSYKNIVFLDFDDTGEFMDHGWNYFLRPESGQFERLYRRGNVQIQMAIVPGFGVPVPTLVHMEKNRPIYDVYPFKYLFRQGIV